MSLHYELVLTKSNWMGCWMALYLQAWALCPPVLDQSLMSEYFQRLMLKLKSVDLNCNSNLAVVRLHRLYFDLLQSKMALLLVADSLQISFPMCPRRLKSIAPGLNFSVRVKYRTKLAVQRNDEWEKNIILKSIAKIILLNRIVMNTMELAVTSTVVIRWS